MRDRLLTAPRWALCVLFGVYFGTAMALFGAWQDGDGWRSALILGVVSGSLFGAFMGPWQYRQNQRLVAASGDTRGAPRRAALRAAMRGPVPADPQVRAAAQRLAEHHVQQYRRLRTFSLVTFSLLLLLSVFMMVAESGWWSVTVGMWAAMLLGQLWLPRHLERRTRLLAAT